MGNVTDNLSEAGSHIKQAAAHAGDSLKGAAAAASDELRLGRANAKAELAVEDVKQLFDVGSVAELRGRVLQRCIRARTRVPAEEIARWPGVHAVRHDGQALEIQAEPAEPIVARLLAADPQLDELEVRRAGLADAFLALTARPGPPMNAEEAA